MRKKKKKSLILSTDLSLFTSKTTTHQIQTVSKLTTRYKLNITESEVPAQVLH